MVDCRICPKATAQSWCFLLALVILTYSASDVWSLVVSWYMKHMRLPGRNPHWVHQQEEPVSMLPEWKAVLGQDLLELYQLEGQDAATRMRRSLKEQAIGQHCCQAGEHLDDADLSLLKEALGVGECQWHIFQSHVRPAQEM
jgi:hypothetical protein